MVKVRIEEIKFNPFKKFINGGKLEEERVDKLVESIEHGTLQPNFVGRKNEKGQYEISSGHHRIGAFKKKFGKDFKVEFMPIKFSDEQMLVDMVRENLTQRGEGSFRDTEESAVLTRAWRLSKFTSVKQFHKGSKEWLSKRLHKNNGTFVKGKMLGSYRDIADFLSKNGKAISYHTVANYLKIHDNLDGNLKKKLENLENATDKDAEEKMGIKTAIRLARIKDKADQRKAWELVQANRLNSKDAEKFISAYRENQTVTPEIITRQQYENYHEDEDTIKSINFKKDFEQAKNNYLRDIELWEKYPTQELSKSDKQYYTEIIQDVIKEEQKVIKIMGTKK